MHSIKNMTKPPANVLELPLEVRAEMAFKVAIEKLVDERAAKGMTMFICRDNAVYEMSVEEVRELSARNHAND